MIWVLALSCYLLTLCLAGISLWTAEGPVVIGSKEYYYHNSELKLLCLCSLYRLGTFQPSMLVLQEASTTEILQLPCMFWNQLSAEEFAQMACKIDIAQLLNHFVAQDNLNVIWKPLKHAFLKRKRIMSRQLNLNSLSEAAMNVFLGSLLCRYDPYQLLLQASPTLVFKLNKAGVNDPILFYKNLPHAFLFFDGNGHDKWADVITQFLELRFQGRLESALETWEFFERHYLEDNSTCNSMKHILEHILDDLDMPSMSKNDLQKCLHLYTVFDRLSARLGLYSYSSRLRRYIETEMDLSDWELWNLVWPLPFKIVGETMLLLGQATGRVYQLEIMPDVFIENFKETVRYGYSAPGWVASVAVPASQMQMGLQWAITWYDEFEMPLAMVQEWIDHFDDLDPTAFPLLPILHFMRRHSEQAHQLRYPTMNSRNQLSIRLLSQITRSIVGHIPGHDIDDEHRKPSKGPEPVKRTIRNWRVWSIEDWNEASMKELFDLVILYGLAKIYNHLSLMDVELPHKLFAPDLFQVPRFSASIRFRDVRDDLIIPFAKWIMPLIDQGSFYSVIRPEDVTKLTVYWKKLGLKLRFEDFAGQPGPSRVAFIGDVITSSRLSCTRRPIDIVRDRLTVPMASGSALILWQIAESYWKDLASEVEEVGVSEQDLFDFWVCPSLRRGNVKNNPFWKALHQTVDFTAFGARHWEIVTMMAVERELEVLLAAAYFAGTVREFPAGVLSGLPFPSWMTSFPLTQRLAFIEQYLEGSIKLQEALLLMVKWRPDVILPESLVDWIVKNYWRQGMRFDLGLVAIHHALGTSSYKLPEDTPPSSQALVKTIRFMQQVSFDRPDSNLFV